MTTIYNNFNVEAARSFKEKLSATDNNTYFFLGKDSMWPDEDNPDGTPTTDSYINSIHHDMILAKKVGAIDVTLCILRKDWLHGEVYDQYDMNNPTLHTRSNFYVMTDDYNIYKCMNNNQGQPSTIKPTGIGITPFTTSDGYSWKFMFSVPQDQVTKFLNSQYIPVRDTAPITDPQSRVQSQARYGSIESYDIVDGGGGYENPRIEIIGDGRGAIAIPEINDAGSITNVRIYSMGNDYTWAEVVVSGDGTGAKIIPQIIPGKGHGHNPANELGGHHVMIAVDFSLDTSDISGINNPPSTFSFRRTGLFTRPVDAVDDDLLPVTSFAISACHKIYYQSQNVFESGDIIEFSETDGTARVIETGVDDEGSYLIVNEVTVRFDENDLSRYSLEFILQGYATVGGTMTNVLRPDIIPNMYDTLYLDNRSRISTNPNQVEGVRMVVEF